MRIEDLKIINPKVIDNGKMPVFVQSADMRGIIGYGIRKRTKSNWNHSMIMRKSGKLVSQNATYREIDAEKYMKPGCIMKFWVCQDITPVEKALIFLKIRQDLKKPWYKKMYDYPGVVGQFFGLRWFNIPGLNYCSERVRDKLVILFPDIMEHPTPEDIDTIFKESPRMKLLGYYINA